MTKTDRDHIRQRREEENRLRLEREARERRNRLVKSLGIVGAAVIAVAGVVALVVFGPSWFGPAAAKVETDGTVQITQSDGAVVDVPISSVDDGAAIQVGRADAPVTLDFWFDFSCPHCIEYHVATAQTMHDLAASGQAKINFRPVNIVAPYGLEAGAALLSAVQHQPDRFFAVYDGLFLIDAQTQQGWGAADYADVMGQFGVTDESALAEIRAGAMRPTIQTLTNRALKQDGLKGTPALAVNGQIQGTLPDAQGLIDMVAANGADPAQIPTPAATPNPAA